ncbi:MAG: dTDP-4-dehydrorhamnose reductase [Rhodospirillales bacterium]|nr:dTDP-4-dehydrorhamnose reductase [Rhodospirillales bacterium]
MAGRGGRGGALGQGCGTAAARRGGLVQGVRRILVTGASGQVGGAVALARPDVVALGREALDFDRPSTIAAALEAHAPGVVINAAAYTAVDRAEGDAAAAMRANRDGPAELARCCAERDIALIHVSTDYVFDGNKGAPYVETDLPAPTGVYGASKRAGEEAVLATGAKAVIVRTAWVFSATGRNFVRTLLAAATRNPTLRVVADQHGCPTAAPDLAQVLLGIADRLEGGWRDGYRGIVHAAGGGASTWHELAVALFEERAKRGEARPVIEPIPTAAWPTPVRRPPDSRLDQALLLARFGLAMPPWRDGLARVVEQL